MSATPKRLAMMVMRLSLNSASCFSHIHDTGSASLAVYLSWSFYPRKQSLPPIRSLAVRPLKNLSGDASQDYFTDGMTDELITHLGQINTLRVISRTSAMNYKGNHKPLAEIARELNVEAVVEGSVLRSGERVRIIAQLI